MARPKSTYGIFRLKPGCLPREVDGDAIERHVELTDAQKSLSTHRDAARVAQTNPYDIVVLPLGPRGEGLLGPGM